MPSLKLADATVLYQPHNVPSRSGGSPLVPKAIADQVKAVQAIEIYGAQGRNRTTDTAIFSEPDYRFKPLQIGSFCPPKNGDIVSRTAQALSDRFTLFHIKFRVWFPIDTQRISRLPRAMGI